MPADSHFIQSGYDIQHNEAQGDWIACKLDEAQGSDWCRITDAHGMVVFQGNYMPVNSLAPVPNDRMQLANVSVSSLWVPGPVEGGPVPVIPLASGEILVPAVDRDALSDRWAKNPDELRHIQGQD